MKINHLISQQWRSSLINQLLNDQDILINHQFKSFNQAFFERDETSSYQRLFKAIILVNKHLLAFPILSKVLIYPDTIKEALSFLDDCDKWSIDTSTLFSSEPVTKEKIELLQLLDQEITVRPYRKPFFEPNSTYVNYASYQTLFEQHFLEKHHIETKEFPPIVNPTINAYQALNMRQECEALAQLIYHNPDEEYVIACADLPGYQNELVRQLDTYQIDYSINLNWLPTLFQAYYHLVLATQNQAKKSWLSFFKLNPFHLPFNHRFVEYLETFSLSWTDSFDLVEQNDLLDYRTIDYLSDLQQQAQRVQKIYHQKLANINQNSLAHILTSSFDALKECGNRTLILSLKSKVESLAPYLQSDLFDTFFWEVLSGTQSEPITESAKVIITDLKNGPILSVNNLVLLGITTHSFPGFSELKELYNEDFVKNIREYPSLEQRVQHHSTQIKNLLYRGRNLIISSPLMDYSGKQFEKPLEIETFLKEHQVTFKAWSIVEPEVNPLKIKNLDSSLAQQLFFTDDQLRGSISSFETYLNSSYQYFIERGLRVRKPQSYKLNEALVGTIMHAVMEQLINQQGQEYVNCSEADISKCLEEYQALLTRWFKGEANWTNFVMRRVHHQLSLLLKRLKPFQELSPYQPFQNEYNFKDYQGLVSNRNISINGYVDRIDANKDSFIVLDYKSSGKTMSEKEVLAGKKLQLITYGMVISELIQKRLIGVYYINLAYSFITRQLTKFGVKTGIDSNTTAAKLHEKEDRLTGFTFEMDEDHPLLDSVRLKFVKTRGVISPLYDLEKVKDYFNLLYTHLYDSLYAGKITLYHDPGNAKYFEMADSQRVKNSLFKTVDAKTNIGLDDDFSLLIGGSDDET